MIFQILYENLHFVFYAVTRVRFIPRDCFSHNDVTRHIPVAVILNALSDGSPDVRSVFAACVPTAGPREQIALTYMYN